MRTERERLLGKTHVCMTSESEFAMRPLPPPTLDTNRAAMFIAARIEFVGLAAKTQPLDDFLVLLRFGRLQIVEQLAPLVHHLHQTATRSVIALVGREVIAKTVDALGQQRNLYFRRTRVLRVATELR